MTDRIIEIKDINDERVAVYAALSDAQLRSRVDKERAVLIAESPKVIRVALDAGYRPLSLLCEQRHITGDAADIIERLDEDIPVYTGSREVLRSLTGYTLTRGVLCAMQRPADIRPADIIGSARRVAVLDGVCDTTNVGAIFRAAAAMGIDAVLLTPTTCDPFNRRSIRVSMGTVFLVPWAWVDDASTFLHSAGFKTAALALKPHSISLDDPRLDAEPRLGLILGTEGDGLAQNVIDDADYSVIIPMKHGVDSLNVASAAAVAFWQLRAKE